MEEDGGVFEEVIEVTGQKGYELERKVGVRVWKSKLGYLKIEVRDVEIEEGEQAEHKRNKIRALASEWEAAGSITKEAHLKIMISLEDVKAAGDTWGEGDSFEDALVVGVAKCLRNNIREVMNGIACLNLELGYGGYLCFQEDGDEAGNIQGRTFKVHGKDKWALPTSKALPNFMLQGMYVPQDIPDEALVYCARPYVGKNGTLRPKTFAMREVLEAANYHDFDDGVDNYRLQVVGVPDSVKGGKIFMWTISA